MWVIAVVAALQLFGVFWAMMKRPRFGSDMGSYASAPSAFQGGPSDSPTFPPMPLNSGAGGQTSVPKTNPGFEPGGQIGNNSVVGNSIAVANAGASGAAVTEPLTQPGPTMGVNLGGVGFSANHPDKGGGNAALTTTIGNGVRSGVFGEAGSSLEPIGVGEPALAQPGFVGPEHTATFSPGSLTDSLTEASLSAMEIQDPIVERLVTAGVELRSTDNMQGALQALKEAEAALPTHPRIMSELAATYRQMGLDNKADNYWEKVDNLGEIGAGYYYPIARQQLRGEATPDAGTVDRIMKIGQVLIEEKSAGDAAQKISARILIKAEEGSNPDGENLSVLVFFYDQVDGAEIKPSTADASYLFPTEPYDWTAENKEEIIVNYSQPIFSEEETRELGERKYFGYVIQLYYQDELQDRVVRPPELEQYHFDAPLSSPREPRGLEPENTLFPD
jgi:hypothetical protein